MNYAPIVHTLDLRRLLDLARPLPARSERPPYMATMAMLESLCQMGIPAKLWNAKLHADHALLVVAGVELNGLLLDWNGDDPREHAHGRYPALRGGVYQLAGEADLIPGKRTLSWKVMPWVHDRIELALDHLLLEAGTDHVGRESGAQGEPLVRRL